MRPSLPISRRTALQSAACGFGYLALSGLTSSQAAAAINPMLARKPLFPARAKRVIFLFMQGGVSQVDSFDYKPALFKRNGEKLEFDDARVRANTGKTAVTQRVMKP